MEIGVPSVQFSLLLPEFILVITACVIALWSKAVGKSQKGLLGIVAFAATALALGLASMSWAKNASTLSGLFLLDSFAVFFKCILLLITALTILISKRFLAIEDADRGEYYALILLAAFGMLIMVSSGDVLTMYLGLETMAISSYILAAYFRSDERSSEAGLKYFLLGAINSGIILYGLALLYGIAGSLNLPDIRNAVLGISEPNELRLLHVALALLIAGFGFKVAAAPFHMWAPDVYEGAPTPVTAFLSAGSKTAAFGALLRLFVYALGPHMDTWSHWLVSISGVTMIVGNVTALRQTNVKRLMAYSSIAHVGYMLMGLASGNNMGLSAVMLYLLIYLFSNIGIFSALVLLARKDRKTESVSDFTGLSKRHPMAALAITVFLFSLTGIPPTGGFVGKFYLFLAAVKAGLFKLAIIGVLTSVLSLFYYMKIVMAMYMEKSVEEKFSIGSMPTALGYAFSIMVFGVIICGIYPAPFLDLAQASLSSLLLIIR